jgi:hypothetical protein
MGRIITPVTVSNFVDPGSEIVCDALVDTGAYCLTLPASWKPRLGTLAMSRQVELETADHRTVSGEICGPVRIRISAFDVIAGEVLFTDMEPSDGRYEPLVGYITLEQAGLAVDVVGHRLIRVPRLDLKRSRHLPA